MDHWVIGGMLCLVTVPVIDPIEVILPPRWLRRSEAVGYSVGGGSESQFVVSALLDFVNRETLHSRVER